MTFEDAEAGAKIILEKRRADGQFRVAVDSPKDCDQSIKAFKKLGCKVKIERDGRMLLVTVPKAD